MVRLVSVLCGGIFFLVGAWAQGAGEFDGVPGECSYTGLMANAYYDCAFTATQPGYYILSQCPSDGGSCYDFEGTPPLLSVPGQYDDTITEIGCDDGGCRKIVLSVLDSSGSFDLRIACQSNNCHDGTAVVSYSPLTSAPTMQPTNLAFNTDPGDICDPFDIPSDYSVLLHKSCMFNPTGVVVFTMCYMPDGYTPLPPPFNQARCSNNGGPTYARFSIYDKNGNTVFDGQTLSGDSVYCNCPIYEHDFTNDNGDGPYELRQTCSDLGQACSGRTAIFTVPPPTTDPTIAPTLIPSRAPTLMPTANLGVLDIGNGATSSVFTISNGYQGEYQAFTFVACANRVIVSQCADDFPPGLLWITPYCTGASHLAVYQGGAQVTTYGTEVPGCSCPSIYFDIQGSNCVTYEVRQSCGFGQNCDGRTSLYIASLPTEAPTEIPTAPPTDAPSDAPVAAPTLAPQADPTGAPLVSPTAAPQPDPTTDPSLAPTAAPQSTSTVAPQATPTFTPQAEPTAAPQAGPTVAPQATPTVAPQSDPTVSPSANPTAAPQSTPTVAPQATPTLAPQADPTAAPQAGPTVAPQATPTVSPQATPTVAPRADPTSAPVPLSPLNFRADTYKVKNGFAFAARASDGTVHTWGEAPYGGDSAGVTFGNVTSIVAGRFAFVALNKDHTIVPWGARTAIVGASSGQVTGLVANEAAFAGILSGTNGVIALGSKHNGGDVTSDARCNGFSDKLSSGVERIAASECAFAALKTDSTVYAWGNVHCGAGVSSVSNTALVGVQKVVATREAFAALLSTGAVKVWGGSLAGGDASSAGSELDSGVLDVTASRNAFVAVKTGGKLVVWGYGPYGGDTLLVQQHLDSGVTSVAHTFAAFAALKDTGEVHTWGRADSGGDSSAVSAQLHDIVSIHGAGKAFAAINSTGGVVAWGKAAYGGVIPADKRVALSSGVVSIHSTDRAFVALKGDGGVVVWGQAGHGGSPGAAVEALLARRPVHTVCSNDAAFSAINTDGEVIGWGHPVSIAAPGVIFSSDSLKVAAKCD